MSRVLCRNLALISLLAVLTWLPVDAMGQVSLLPKLQELDLRGGRNTRFQLRVANRGEEARRFTMHAWDLDITEAGLPFAVIDSTQRSCAGWIHFEPEFFVLEAEGIMTIDCKLDVPKGSQGSFSSFITAEYRPESPEIKFGTSGKSTSRIDFSMSVSSVLMVSLRGRDSSIKLSPSNPELDSGQQKGQANPFLGDGGEKEGWQLTLPVLNEGDLHAVAAGEVSIWTEGMQLVEKTDLHAGRGFILPGKVRNFIAEGERVLEDGIYLIKINLMPKQARMVQGLFPITVYQGEVQQGNPDPALRKLMAAFTPRFSLTAGSLDFEITPGSHRTRGLRIRNHSETSLRVLPRIISWGLDDKGQMEFEPPAAEVTRSCVSWIKADPETLFLKPRAAGSVKFKMTAPETLDGEYYAAVLFEDLDRQHDIPDNLKLARTAILTASSSGNVEFAAELAPVDHNDVGPLMRVFTVNVVNMGNIHCYARGKVTIYDQDWAVPFESVEFGSDNAFILPGRTRGFAVPVPGALELGRYKAVVEIDYTERMPSLIQEYFFDQVLN